MRTTNCGELNVVHRWISSVNRLRTYRLGLGRLLSPPVDQAAVDEYAVGRPVLGQRERLVAVRRLPLHPLEDGLRLGPRAHAQDVGAGDVQKCLEVVATVNLLGGYR